MLEGLRPLLEEARCSQINYLASQKSDILFLTKTHLLMQGCIVLLLHHNGFFNSSPSLKQVKIYYLL